MNIIKIIQTFWSIMMLLMPLVTLAEIEITGDKMGEERKKKVMLELKQNIQKVGIALPTWFATYEDMFFGLIINLVVAIFNTFGFFTSGTTLPTD